MNHENLYLIHEDTYIDHINEKVQLYSMVKQLCHMVKNLPDTHSSKGLNKLAAVFEERSEAMFKTWNIPGSYLVFGKEEDLVERISEDLWIPEILGYYHRDDLCDDCCPCGDECHYCVESDDGDEEFDQADATDETAVDNRTEDDEVSAENIGEMFAALGEVLHSIFGDNITVHVFTE